MTYSISNRVRAMRLSHVLNVPSHFYGFPSQSVRKDSIRDEVHGDETTEETHLRREKRRATSHEDLEATYADEALRKQVWRCVDTRLPGKVDPRTKDPPPAAPGVLYCRFRLVGERSLRQSLFRKKLDGDSWWSAIRSDGNPFFLRFHRK